MAKSTCEMMTLVEAKKQLAELEEVTKNRAKMLRAYIRVLESNRKEDGRDE